MEVHVYPAQELVINASIQPIVNRVLQATIRKEEFVSLAK
jgi:hypothetical protein